MMIFGWRAINIGDPEPGFLWVAFCEQMELFPGSPLGALEGVDEAVELT